MHQGDKEYQERSDFGENKRSGPVSNNLLLLVHWLLKLKPDIFTPNAVKASHLS